MIPSLSPLSASEVLERNRRTSRASHPSRETGVSEMEGMLYSIFHSFDTATISRFQPPPPFDQHFDDPNAVLITASFGRIIPDTLLHLFPPSRRLNVHPSLLPLYRGPAPIQHAIADGCAQTGVCVIEMKERTAGVDSGEIWAKRVVVSGISEMAFSSVPALILCSGFAQAHSSKFHVCRTSRSFGEAGRRPVGFRA